MTDPRDYKLELSGIAAEAAAPQAGGGVRAVDRRPFLSVQFACCDVYTRIYRSADGAVYSGHCPKCAKPATFRVGPGGTDAREFVVY